MKKGDVIAAIATPIARALKLPCIDPKTQELRPESTCNKVRIGLNEGRYADAFYDRFWSKDDSQQKGTIMEDYIVTQTKQIAITANSPEEAQLQVLRGEGRITSSSLSANVRPQPHMTGHPQIIQTSKTS